MNRVPKLHIFDIGPSSFGVVETNCHSATKQICRCQIEQIGEVVAILVKIRM